MLKMTDYVLHNITLLLYTYFVPHLVITVETYITLLLCCVQSFSTLHFLGLSYLVESKLSVLYDTF